MQYILNGGGHEMRSLASPAVSGWLREQGVQHLLFVSFAMAEDFWQRMWENPEHHINLDGITVKSLTMTNYSAEKAQQALAACDAVFIPGGMPDVLMTRLTTTGLGEMLGEAVAQDRLVCIGGASAGEMALGEKLIVGGGPGLGIIKDHIFDAHFSSRRRLSRLQQAVDDSEGTVGVGIDEDTTLILDAAYQPQQIFGPGNVTYYQYKQEPNIYDSHSSF